MATTSPDIHYFPDLAKYQARTRYRLETDPDTADRRLPTGFPSELKSGLVWEGKDFDTSDDWIYTFDEADLQEIESASKTFLGKATV